MNNSIENSMRLLTDEELKSVSGGWVIISSGTGTNGSAGSGTGTGGVGGAGGSGTGGPGIVTFTF